MIGGMFPVALGGGSPLHFYMVIQMKNQNVFVSSSSSSSSLSFDSLDLSPVMVAFPVSARLMDLYRENLRGAFPAVMAAYAADDTAAIFRVSSVEKLDGLGSWSIQAGLTCPGSVDNAGVVANVCAGCYALRHTYISQNVVAHRSRNTLTALLAVSFPDYRAKFVAAAVAEISALVDTQSAAAAAAKKYGTKSPFVGARGFFRLFDSGDFFCPALVEIWGEIIAAVNRDGLRCRFWVPSRTRFLPAFSAAFDAFEKIPGVALRASSDNFDGSLSNPSARTVVADFHSADHVKNLDALSAFRCGAAGRGGKCGPCRVCFSNSKIVAYPAHGAGAGAYKKIALAAVK